MGERESNWIDKALDSPTAREAYEDDKALLAAAERQCGTCSWWKRGGSALGYCTVATDGKVSVLSPIAFRDRGCEHHRIEASASAKGREG